MKKMTKCENKSVAIYEYPLNARDGMQAWKKMDLSSKTSSIHYFWASSTSFVSRFHSEWFYDEKKPLFLKARVHYVRDTRFNLCPERNFTDYC